MITRFYAVPSHLLDSLAYVHRDGDNYLTDDDFEREEVYDVAIGEGVRFTEGTVAVDIYGGPYLPVCYERAADFKQVAGAALIFVDFEDEE